MLTLRLTIDEAILLRDALMVQLQSAPISRPEIQRILDAVNVYLAIKLREVAHESR